MSVFKNVLRKTLDQETFSSEGQAASIDVANGVADCQTVALQVVVADITPSNPTFAQGTSEVSTLTLPAKAASTGGDYVVVYDTAGLGWACALNKSGSDPVPSGAIYTAIASGRKSNVNISGATTAASVAALIRTAFLALTSFPMTIVDNSDGTLSVTCTLHGNTTNATPHNANDSGAGSITTAVATPGVNSAVDVTANTVTMTASGLTTGLAVTLTSTGTLPAGVTTSTTYYIIAVDANTVKFASTLAHALAGTAIDLTNQGTGAAVGTVHVTALAGDLILRGSIDGDNWFDLSPSQSLAAGVLLFGLVWPTTQYIALGIELDSGSITVDQKVLGKGIL